MGRAASTGHTDELSRRRRQAAERWSAATGGQPACRIDDESDPLVAKYHEGEVAALGEALRTVLAEGPRDALPVVRAARDRWAHRAVSLAAARGPEWRAYDEGGRDALNAFLEAAEQEG